MDGVTRNHINGEQEGWSMTELYHHGIKGMKWGIRRTPEQLGHPRSTRRKSKSKDYKRASVRAKATTAELKRRQERLKLENEVRRLEWENASEAEKLDKQVSDLLLKFGAYTLVGGIVVLGTAYGTKKLYPKIASRYGNVDMDTIKQGAEFLQEIIPGINKIIPKAK